MPIFQMLMKAIKGIKVCRQGRAFGKMILTKIDPSGKSYYWLTGSFSSKESN